MDAELHTACGGWPPPVVRSMFEHGILESEKVVEEVLFFYFFLFYFRGGGREGSFCSHVHACRPAHLDIDGFGERLKKNAGSRENK